MVITARLGRAIYLLRKQIPVKAWVNSIVFFDDDELESVSVCSDNVWFDRYQELVAYIQNNGNPSFGSGAIDFFEKCVPADYLYANAWNNFLHCIIIRDTLQLESIPADKIVSIRISHHWSYDKLYVKLTDGSEKMIALENGKIRVNENGHISTYAFFKLDYIEMGKTLIQ